VKNNKRLLAAEIMPWTLGIITSKVPLKTFLFLELKQEETLRMGQT
jgi:hypothetical protein